jgi:hypothetical protein
MSPLHAVAIFGAGFVGGTINSIAGGGTLVTFPVLLWTGLTPIVANATSTFALCPGALSSAWGYRNDLRRVPRRYLAFLAPCVAGGLLGALLLRRTPEAVFAAAVPFLILAATLLFALQEPLQRWQRRAGRRLSWSGAIVLVLVAGTYGGYFGAGLGIVMLAILGLVGMTDIHQMNGVKNFFGFVTNCVAAVYFAITGMVRLPEAGLMMLGAILGGVCSAAVARRLGRTFARRAVIAIGITLTLLLLVRRP